MPLRITTLKRRSDFLRVRAARRSYVTTSLILQSAPSDATDPDLLQVGYTATKRIGNAVARNRAKRRLRAAVAHVMPARASRGCNYVVIARAATLTQSFEALRSDLTAALGRVKVERIGEKKREGRKTKLLPYDPSPRTKQP